MPKGLDYFNIKIDNEYFIGVEDTDDKRGIGAYSNGCFGSLGAFVTSKIITSQNFKKAKKIEGHTNLKSNLDVIMRNGDFEVLTIRKLKESE